MTRYQIILLTLIITSLCSCQKYLEKKPTTDQRYIETAKDGQLLLDNYSTMNVAYASDNEVSADDYFLINSKFSTIAQEDQNFYGWNPAANRKDATSQWQLVYQKVYYANLVIDLAEKLRGKESDSTVKALRSSALFYRAFCIWQMAQLYCKAYNATTAAQDPGIPIRLTPDMNEVSERGTLQQTYDRLINDLKEAVGSLPPTAIVPSRPSQVAVHSLLARVYLAMGKYTDALNSAESALQIKSNLINYNSISTSSSSPFSPRFNAEIIFHAVMSPIPILTPGTAGNPTARIAQPLVDLYNSNDLRKKIFLKANTMSVSLDQPSNVTLNDGTYRFTGNYDGVNNASLFCGIAVDEVYLVRAECYARSGQTQKAMDDINTLLQNRFATGTYTNQSASTPEDALAIVLAERRKELLMRGLRWTDLKRLNLPATRKTITITFTGTVASPVRVETVNATYSLAANDLRYALLIPQTVLLYTSMSQNPR